MKTGCRDCLPLYPFPGIRNGSRYIHLSLLDGVDELYMAGQEAYPTVRIGTLCPILQVSFDGASHV